MVVPAVWSYVQIPMVEGWWYERYGESRGDAGDVGGGEMVQGGGGRAQEANNCS